LTENNNTHQFIKQLAEREGVSEEKIKEIIIESFRKSYCQGENSGAELHFEFESGLSVHRLYKIVENISDPEKEITKDNKLLKEGQIKGDNFLLPLDIKNLSLSLNQEIKNRLRKDVGEISWDRQYKLFKSRQGELVKGTIKSTQEKNYYLVDLGKGVGHWEKAEWKLREEPRLGQHFYFLVKEVREKLEKDTPQIILTRSDDLFIQRLLEQEIPEIKKGAIVIRHTLRLPGLLSKVIVESKEWGVDALGTCIGRDAERIRTVSRLVYPERVDIATWTDDKKKLLFNLLSPVKIIKLIIKQGAEWEIIVLQQKASLLLQHEGKILKKVSEYLGINIHVKILEEIEKDEVLENKGKVMQEIGNYKNVDVQILEEIEK